MKLPTILIIGRPNVGKSTLVNRLILKRAAITLDTPGVTRDLTEYRLTVRGKSVMLIDSGGAVLGQKVDKIQAAIDEKVRMAVQTANRIIWVVDVTMGVVDLDMAIAALLRDFAEKVVIAANKADDPSWIHSAAAFYQLGMGDPLPVSALNGWKVDELLARAMDGITGKSVPDTVPHRISIVGRPNVGKSSLLNAILNSDRVIVDNVAGTTRDSIEAHYQSGDHHYVFVDTAGIRKRAKIEDGIEYYSVLRSTRAMTSADLVVVVLDVNEFLIEQDKKIIRQVLDLKKNMVIFINKWDLTDRSDARRSELLALAEQQLPGLASVPIIVGSATEKHHLGQLFTEIPRVISSGEFRISTGELNAFLKKMMQKNIPTAKYGKAPKIYYMTQAESNPPTFVIFVNHPDRVTPLLLRYLENRIREHVHPFRGNPIQWVVKGHRSPET